MHGCMYACIKNAVDIISRLCVRAFVPFHSFATNVLRRIYTEGFTHGVKMFASIYFRSKVGFTQTALRLGFVCASMFALL